MTFIPNAYDLTTSGLKKKLRDYKRTLDFYRLVYGEIVNEEIWNTDEIGTEKEFKWHGCNYLRYFCFKSIE